MIKKMALGFLATASISLPFFVVSCSNIDKTFTVNLNGAKSLKEFKDRLEDLVSKVTDVSLKVRDYSRGYPAFMVEYNV